MRNTVKYEWCYETRDENGDIIDSDFEDSLHLFQDNRKTPHLCLVRNEGNENAGLEERYWAYVKGSKLPQVFEDAQGHEVNIQVPQRFHVELYKFIP